MPPTELDLAIRARPRRRLPFTTTARFFPNGDWVTSANASGCVRVSSHHRPLLHPRRLGASGCVRVSSHRGRLLAARGWSQPDRLPAPPSSTAATRSLPRCPLTALVPRVPPSAGPRSVCTRSRILRCVPVFCSRSIDSIVNSSRQIRNPHECLH